METFTRRRHSSRRARQERRAAHPPDGNGPGGALRRQEGLDLALAVNAKQVARILRSETGHNTIFTVQVATGPKKRPW